ncbi:shikimate dehydrogenase [Desulfurobacterium sp.]
MLRITGKTDVYGIFGFPVKHSLSPLMQTAAFEALGIDAVYVPFEVNPDNLGGAVSGLRAMNIKGINVTVPLKEKIVPFLDRIDEVAAFLGAVNTVKNENGVLSGYNTDGDGFVDSLEEEGVDVRGKTVLLIGAGGSGKAVAFALLKRGAGRVIIANRTLDRAVALSEKLKSYGDVEAISLEDVERVLSSADLIVNTTSVGMRETDPPLFDYEVIPPSVVVVDIIYKPFKTELLKVAEGKGAKIINGLGMLVHQGARAFRIWTGKEPPVDVMKRVILEQL